MFLRWAHMPCSASSFDGLLCFDATVMQIQMSSIEQLAEAAKRDAAAEKQRKHEDAVSTSDQVEFPQQPTLKQRLLQPLQGLRCFFKV